jgi:PAS domain S-box-containing protein
MAAKKRFDEASLRAQVAELKRHLAEAQEALNAAVAGAAHRGGPPVPRDLITEAQHTLTLEHNLLRTVIDMIPDHVFVRDRIGRHVINNKAQLDQLRASTLEETIGKTDLDFYPPETAQRFKAVNDKVMSSGEPLIAAEEMGPGPDGLARWWSTTKVPLMDADGQVIGLVGISRDITEHRSVTQKIIEQAAMLDQAHDAIFLLTLDGRIAYLNAAAEQMLGWSAKEAIGKLNTEIVPPEDRVQMAVASRETLEKGSWHGEFRLHHRSGRELFADVRRTLIRDDTGTPKAQLSICADVTEKKKAEALALRNQRLESLGTLAGGIAHDLNNVLAPILMAITLLKMKVTDEGGTRLLTLLEQNAERGAQLVRHVLAFGRGADGSRVVVQPLLIAREIEEIVKDTFPKNVRFELRAEKHPWTLTGDPNQIHQVLLNLCVNARDAMPGGGKITLRIKNEMIDVTFASMNQGAQPGPFVEISIADTGMGMPAEVRDRIFEPFFTTKDVGKGTGLGLSTSLGIIQGHGGFIGVSSNPGKGSTFRVYLPANPASAVAASEAEKTTGLPRGHNELVLVVDDEEAILEVAKSTLEGFGYRVVVATNGAAAVSIYAMQRDAIAVVLTDMAMPIMDGPAMVVALKAINPDIRIIGSSGLSGQSAITATRVSGVREFVPKPYSAETLLNAIARVIGSTATRDGKGPPA